MPVCEVCGAPAYSTVTDACQTGIQGGYLAWEPVGEHVFCKKHDRLPRLRYLPSFEPTPGNTKVELGILLEGYQQSLEHRFLNGDVDAAEFVELYQHQAQMIEKRIAKKEEAKCQSGSS